MNNTSQRDQPSRSASKRAFNRLATKGKFGLAVDTSFTRHTGEAPKQVFPYESKTQELTFVSIADAKAAKAGRKGSWRSLLESRAVLRPAPGRSISQSQQPDENVLHAVKRPVIERAETGTARSGDVLGRLAAQKPLPVPVHKRIRGLRPSPLDLASEISPADRAITIGLAVPPTAISDHAITPQSGLQPHSAQQVQTPTIVITPAKEDFDDEDVYRRQRASSTYSRYTNGYSKRHEDGATPPVPPLPLFVGSAPSTRGVDEVQHGPRKENAVSVCTVFEEDVHGYQPPMSARSFASQSHLPTPRRSKGWWNVVTSPFSAGSRLQNAVWRSPSPQEADEDCRSMLHDASEMSTTDAHAGVIFTNRMSGDDELRSAIMPHDNTLRPNIPKRSDTAPGALDANVPALNIYRIPSRGLAAEYYDLSTHFPELSRGSMDGWSPSQSVAHPSRESRSLSVDALPSEAAATAEAASLTRDASLSPKIVASPEEFSSRAASPEAGTTPGPETANTHNPFSTPSEEEMTEKSPAPPVVERGNTDATLASHFSPLSPTPVLESARMGTFMGPQSANEPREVQLTPARTASPLDTSTDDELPMNRGVEPMMESQTRELPPPPPEMRPSLHSRNDSSSSLGLGITSEKELFPPPTTVTRQPTLRTDRWGQLTIDEAARQGPRVPFYRRFFWLLAATAAFLLLVLVMLLVMLVPQQHNDMPVQASWTNLTGFPALPTGIATVVPPETKKSVSGCVKDEALWSCAEPGNKAPSFRFEIRFRNGTLPSNETQLTRRDGLSSSLFTADSPTPHKDDQLFIGQYVDGVKAPYNGEQTPFYLSLLDPTTLSQSGASLHKRQHSPYPYPDDSPAQSNITTNATTSSAQQIPRPDIQSNGKPDDAIFYPTVDAQPLRLFDRGLDSEHYGFYTYFDRSSYVANISQSINVAGDVALENATAVCTWAQTRLHVQIWTRNGNVAALDDFIPLNGLPAINSTANEMATPGSFPYRVTVTMDRHGGQADRKGVYCYGLDSQQHVMSSVSTWIAEDRAFDGSLINAAKIPSNNGTASQRRSDDTPQYGGIDGGTGGCQCQWQNWQ